MDLEKIFLLDEDIKKYVATQKDNLIFLLRIGSSLHKEEFTIKSDIDYILILDTLHPDFINQFPNRISPALDKLKKNENNSFFYWRVELKSYEEHPIIISIYTLDKFLKYTRERHGNKIYILNEHLFLLGNKNLLEKYKRIYTPNIQTAISDLETLKNPKYRIKFLWAWRSVALLKNNVWLHNKKEIKEYVNINYNNYIEDYKYLENELSKLIKEKN